LRIILFSFYYGTENFLFFLGLLFFYLFLFYRLISLFSKEKWKRSLMAVARGRNSLNKDFFEEGGGIIFEKGGSRG